MSRRTRRIVTVVLAPVAALAAWGVIRLIGIDLVLSGHGAGGTVGAGDVVAAAFAGALAAWGVVLLIERHSRRPRRLWARVGSTALAISLIGPSWLAAGADSVALIGLHAVTAFVVIAGFMSTLPVPDCACEPPPLRWLRNVRA